MKKITGTTLIVLAFSTAFGQSDSSSKGKSNKIYDFYIKQLM